MNESNESNNTMFDMPGAQATGAQFAGSGAALPADGEATAVFAPVDLASVAAPSVAAAGDPPTAARKRRMIWPWIVGAVIVVLAAASGGGFWFFQSHALPGVTLWGTSMTGRSHAQIAAAINESVDAVSVPVSYEGASVDVTFADLGLSVDADAIADEVMDAKRDGAWWERYLPWAGQDVTVEPASAQAADSTVLNDKLSVDEVKPVDAGVQLNADANGFDLVAGQNGQGADAEPVAVAAIDQIESLGSQAEAQPVTVELKSIEPTVTDDIATQAKATLDALVAEPVSIKIGDHQIAAIDAPALAAATTIDANENAKLADGQTRSGYVVFDAAKLQQYYDETIKANLATGREDREVIVNGNGDELDVITEGHDGVTVADGADSAIGTQAADLLAQGGGAITVDGTVDPMQTKTTKRHVVVDLSDNKVYAYENDQLIRSMSMSAGQGNDRTTGQCVGDLCTPTGDFTIWLKYESQDMSGNVTLSDGSTSQWDVKDVGFVNYFSKSGCAIHRIASGSYMSDAQVASLGNTSHGCVGIGWDQAEWFFNWCLMGTSVHVQI